MALPSQYICDCLMWFYREFPKILSKEYKVYGHDTSGR